jgi:hypothetical protein
MTDFIIQLPVANIPVELPTSAVEIGRYQTFAAYLWNGTDPSVWPTQKVVLGAWDESTGLQAGQSYAVDGVTVVGTPSYPVNPNYWTYIRPLGNDGKVATDQLDSIRFAGHSEPKFAVDDNRYPVVEQPFSIRMIRTKITNDGFGHIPWGWTAQVISADPLRDIQARAIAIYSDPAWQNYLYTTGAFTMNATSGYYESVCPVGQRTASPTPIYYALLWGSLQEGTWQLTDLQEGAVQERMHWSNAQGDPGRSVIVTPTPGQNNFEMDPEILSPDGYLVTNAGTINANRLFIELQNGQRDSHDPAVMLWFPTGIDTIGFIWAQNRYESGPEPMIRNKIEALSGFKLRLALTWT